jgi:uncharacterized protein (TIGR04141 family)
MSKSHSFSIYLLKDSYNATNALKNDHKMDGQIAGEALPEGAKLYVLDNPPSPPWWKSYFKITKDLRQTLKAAVVFIPVEGRTFAVTFGHVQHNLKETSYEYDFGLRVTLNSLDPEKLKSTDVLEPQGAKRQRTQLPVDSDLTFFDFDRDATILKSLTGKVKAEHKALFKHATGASNIRISSDVTPDGLPKLCAKLLELYKDETYKTSFPDIQNISPVRDPDTITALNAKLIDAFKAKSDSLALSIPEILDYNDGLWATFTGAGAGLVYDDVFMARYHDYLAQCGVDLNAVSVDTLKHHSLVLTDEDGAPQGERHSLYKCLIFDTQLAAASENYHLCEGNWYLIESGFVKKLTDYLDPLCASTALPAFNHTDEGAFNQAASNASLDRICLDKTSITPKGQKAVEPCDIYEIKNGVGILHHLKISTMSNQLSHLFNQGTNSIHLLRDEDTSRERLKELVKGKAPATRVDEFLKPIEDDNLKVVFGVITHKDPADKSINLPLFSRISLMRAMKDMKRMGIAAEYSFIKDDSAASVGRKKKRKAKPKPDAANDDRGEAEAA